MTDESRWWRNHLTYRSQRIPPPSASHLYRPFGTLVFVILRPQVLATAGADLDMPNSDGHTPIFAAITRGRLECLRYLSLQGSDLRRRDLSAGNTPAMVAASHGQTACLEFIVSSAGPDALVDTNDDGLSSPCFAILCGREDTVKSIADLYPACLVHSDSDDPKVRSPAHCAAAEGHVSYLQILAEASIMVAKTLTPAEAGVGGSKFTAGPLSLSVGLGGASGGIRGGNSGGEGSAETSTVAAGAVAAVAEWWKTGGHRSGSNEHRHRGPFAGCVDASDETPLHAAARGGHVEAFYYLISEGGLNPNARNARGETCLWLAAANNRVRAYAKRVGFIISKSPFDLRG